MSPSANARAVFQPIVDVTLMRLVGFEALARFDDGTSPLEHLRAAEESGHRGQLELRLIEIAVDASAALPAGCFVTLNASGRTIAFPQLADVLGRFDRSWGLELFEGAEAGECLAIREQVDELGGFLLIDDAGTGFSDEKRIRDVRPDIVKIDRSLFWDSLSSADGRRRIQSIFDAAADVDARTLIEGVEDAAQLDAVRELGADLAQGYHLGRPGPAEDVPGMLADLQRRVGVDAARL